MSAIGSEMYSWACDLFPINRSITGQGVRDTLNYIQDIIPEMKIMSFPSGTKVFDWEIPEEWQFNRGILIGPENDVIIDSANSNLHVVGYSIGVDRKLMLSELQEHLHSIPEQPEAIPYITSYYNRSWGFCMPHSLREGLPDGLYHAVIDAQHFSGEMNYGEILIRGKRQEEIFLSTYICHPSLANNEISGPVVTTAIARELANKKDLEFSYRIIFVPETIGSIAYLSRNLPEMKERVIAGLNVSCVGDDRAYSFLPSRNGDTLSDSAARHVLKHTVASFHEYNWLQRGSDERQYCAPGVDLPVASIMRSKYGTYPEYHTSYDDLELISPNGLTGAFKAILAFIMTVECNKRIQSTVLCEPQLGKRGLHSNLSTRTGDPAGLRVKDVLTYSDGRTLLELAEAINTYALDLKEIILELERAGLIRRGWTL